MPELRLEMYTRSVRHAQKVSYCAVALPPCADQRWLGHAYMMKMLSKVDLARNVPHRLSKRLSANWVYPAFIREEMRLGEASIDLQVEEKFIASHLTAVLLNTCKSRREMSYSQLEGV